MDGHWSDSPGIFYKFPANPFRLGVKRVWQLLVDNGMYRLE